eukprot:scaffold43968_cov61-Phaeocystis_antarctica.AAC.4
MNPTTTRCPGRPLTLNPCVRRLLRAAATRVSASYYGAQPPIDFLTTSTRTIAPQSRSSSLIDLDGRRRDLWAAGWAVVRLYGRRRGGTGGHVG